MRRVKIVGTLLIILFVVSMFTVVATVGARARIIRVPKDYPTIQEAINAASDGDTIRVGAGEWFGGIVNKSVRIIGMRGAVIVDGEPYAPANPAHWGFFITPEGSGSTISRFTFRCEYIGDTGNYLFAAIFARKTDNVIVTRNKIYVGNIPAAQLITNWDGNNWLIKHNVIITHESEVDFAGIGIGSVWAYDRGAKDNVVVFNTIIADALSGSQAIWLHVRVNITAREVSDNKVAHNKVVITGPETSAIELSVRYLGEGPMPSELLHDNIIMSNDLRGSTNPFVFDPPELEQFNTISRNRY